MARVLSFLVVEHVRRGELKIVLADHEPPPLPVNLVSPKDRLSVPRVRAFVDFAVPRLKRHYALLEKG